MLAKERSMYSQFRVPICVLPATISNNVPGTSLSIGSDTALNEICSMIDKINQSATGAIRSID